MEHLGFCWRFGLDYLISFKYTIYIKSMLAQKVFHLIYRIYDEHFSSPHTDKNNHSLSHALFGPEELSYSLKIDVEISVFRESVITF